MAVLTVQDIPADGFSPTLGAADAAGDEAEVGPGVFVYITNGGAAGINVTFEVPVAAGGAVTTAKAVAAGADLYLPIPARNAHPHPADTVSRTTSDRATWTYDAVTSVEVAVLRAP